MHPSREKENLACLCLSFSLSLSLSLLLLCPSYTLHLDPPVIIIIRREVNQFYSPTKLPRSRPALQTPSDFPILAKS
ncbi:hypothetical protein QBC40DRAFT_79962 [Triangularia verruculosa]|uniref:Secreted protein n=1 Tax=Triangularia verruculosa TaxID=2587418 RepID=A0AAN6XI12_9PEZI|nr:hypothetical protein QBC40DRAFT_79962 [Triangularia verruculosa]